MNDTTQTPTEPILTYPKVRDILCLRSVKDKFGIQEPIGGLDYETEDALKALLHNKFVEYIETTRVTEKGIYAQIYRLTEKGIKLCDENGIEQH